MSRILFVLIVGMTCLASSLCLGTESMGTPAAKLEFDKGNALVTGGDFSSAAKAYRRAIEIDPDFAQAHQNYIFMTQLSAEQNNSAKDAKTGEKIYQQLQAEYEELSKQHPEKAAYQWALGYMNLELLAEIAENHIRSALTIDPVFAPAYALLSTIDGSRGDLEACREDLRKAVEANPDNSIYRFLYAYELKTANRDEFLRQSKEILQRYPDSEAAVSILYVLSSEAKTPEEKIKYLETRTVPLRRSRGY